MGTPPERQSGLVVSSRPWARAPAIFCWSSASTGSDAGATRSTYARGAGAAATGAGVDPAGLPFGVSSPHAHSAARPRVARRADGRARAVIGGSGARTGREGTTAAPWGPSAGP